MIRQQAGVEGALKTVDPRSKRWDLGVAYEDTFTGASDSVSTS